MTETIDWHFLSGCLLTLLHLVFVGITGLNAANIVGHKSTTSIKAGIAIITILWVLGFGFLLLIPFGLFTKVFATMYLALAAGLTEFLARKSHREKKSFITLDRCKTFFMSLPKELKWLSALVFGIFFLRLGRAVIMPPTAWDAMTYHLFKAASWVQSGQFFMDSAPDAWRFYEVFPPLGDVYFSWAMLGSSSSGWLWIVGGGMYLGCAAGAYALGKEMGLTRERSWLLMLVSISVPAVLSFISACYIDNTVMAVILTASAVFLHGIKTKQPTLLMIGTVGLGLSVGMKITNAVYFMAAAALLIFACMRWKVWSFRRFAIFLLLLLPVFSWQFYLLFQGKGPLHPAAFSLGKWFSDPGVPELKYFLYDGFSRYPLIWEYPKSIGEFLIVNSYGDLAHSNFTFTFALFLILALVAFKGYLSGFISRKLEFTDYSFLALFVAGFVIFITFWLPSSQSYRLMWIGNMARFFSAWYVFLLIPVFLQDVRWVYYFGIGCCLIHCWYSFPVGVLTNDWQRIDFAVAGWGVLVIGGFAGGYYLVKKSPKLFPAALLLSGLSLLGMTELQKYYRPNYYTEDKKTYDILPTRVPSVAMKVLDTPEKKVINYTGLSYGLAYTWFRFPFMGSRLQNEIIYIPPTERGDIFSTTIQYAPPPPLSKEKWLARLAERKVDYVYCSKTLPWEIEWILQSPDKFQWIAGNGDLWQLFKVNK